jgi:hypothetical protein
VGYFIVIVYKEKDIRRIAGIREKADYLNSNTPYDVIPIIVDARVDPPSASRL